MSSREAILGRVRAAIDGAEPETVERRYRRAGARFAEARVDLFCERVGEYRAEVHRVEPGVVGGAVAEACGRRGARAVVVPAGVPVEWRPPGVDAVADERLTAHQLDAVAGVVTGCTVAIAETGTIVLTAGPREGRRALTLVPDLHVCVVEERQIVELVPEALELIAASIRDGRRPVTLVSGPSATSDIELSRVEGVHGPRDLVVLVVRPQSSPQ
ncbi:MAG: LUD domain-containing protein [Actinomycetota bacterium]|nr:LUD domain-containing protein [Actinomycetota bacterium]